MKIKKSTKAPHGPPTRPSAQSEAIPPSAAFVPATGSAQTTWSGRPDPSAHLGRTSRPPLSSVREEHASAAILAEAEPPAPAATQFPSLRHRLRRIRSLQAHQRDLPSRSWPARFKPVRRGRAARRPHHLPRAHGALSLRGGRASGRSVGLCALEGRLRARGHGTPGDSPQQRLGAFAALQASGVSAHAPAEHWAVGPTSMAAIGPAPPIFGGPGGEHAGVDRRVHLFVWRSPDISARALLRRLPEKNL